MRLRYYNKNPDNNNIPSVFACCMFLFLVYFPKTNNEFFAVFTAVLPCLFVHTRAQKKKKKYT